MSVAHSSRGNLVYGMASNYCKWGGLSYLVLLLYFMEKWLVGDIFQMGLFFLLLFSLFSLLFLSPPNEGTGFCAPH